MKSTKYPCRPFALRKAQLPESSRLRSIRSSMRAPASQRAMRYSAYKIGYKDGLRDIHYNPARLADATKSEILAWLAGWRAGQVDLRAEREEARRLRVEIGEM